MAWQQRLTDTLADILRFTIRSTFLIGGISISVGSVYVVCKLVWFSLRYLDRTLFSSPW